jgi:peptidoglycan hydrolase-like protein with peptidoglycan-binding domain
LPALFRRIHVNDVISARIASRKAGSVKQLLVSVLGATLIFSFAPNFVFGTASAPAAPQSSAAAAPAKSPAKAPAKRSTKKKAGTRGQAVPTPDRIREIQAALAKAGNFSGDPTGKWDAASVEAMKAFQTSHGLNATGKIDAPSLQKLGLGSETAGLAPPRTPPAKSPAPPKSQR